MAIQFACHGMLLWLQEFGNVRLNRIRDGQGRPLIHQIIISEKAERFFFEAGLRLKKAPLSFNELCFSLYTSQNSHGRTFVEEIIKSGNARLLQAVMLPANHFSRIVFSNFGLLDNDEMDLLEKEARRSRQSAIVRILEEYRRFATLTKMANLMENNIIGAGIVAERGLMEIVESPRTRSLLGANFVSHIIRERKPRVDLGGLMLRVAGTGAVCTLKLLCEAERALLDTLNLTEREPEDYGEFRQPELFTSFDDFVSFDNPSFSQVSTSKAMNLVDIAAIGNDDSRLINKVHSDVDTDMDRARDEYAVLLRRWSRQANSKDDFCTHLINHLKRESSVYSDEESHYYSDEESYFCPPLDENYAFYRLLEYKVSLLSDYESLEGRLKVLDYLVKERGMAPPSLVDVVRWRSCGVLRWLVDSSYVELAASASKDVDLMRASKNLSFMVGVDNIPGDMSIGVFLCLLAIEFDDLQTLLWLLDEQATPLEKVKIQNWNVAHICAMQGRMEIAATLRNRGGIWDTLASAPCGKRPCDNGRFRAVHLAIDNGYVDVADLLLSCGCPSEDDRGSSLEAYTKQSAHNFVKSWWIDKQKMLPLASELSKLFSMLSKTETIDEIALHVRETECLSLRTWRQSGIEEATQSDRLGFSYFDVLTRCYQDGSPSQFVWICMYCSEIVSGYSGWGLFFPSLSSSDQVGYIQLKELRLLADSQNDLWRRRWLAKPSARKARCVDPADDDPILQGIQEMHIEASIVSCLREQLLYRRALRCVKVSTDEAMWNEIRNNAPVDTIADTLNLILDISTCRPEVAGYEEDIVDDNGCLNLRFRPNETGLTRLIQTHILFRPGIAGNKTTDMLCLFLAVQGYHEVVRWALNHAVWTEQMEAVVIRLAAWRGYVETVHTFIVQSDDFIVSFQSSLRDRLRAAVLGAVEGARLGDLKLYLLHDDLTDQLLDPLIEEGLDGQIERDIFQSWKDYNSLLHNSLSGVAVYNYITAKSSEDERQSSTMLEWLVENTSCSGKSLVEAATLFLERRSEAELVERIIDFLDYLLENFEINIWKCFGTFRRLSRCIVSKRVRYVDREDEPHAVKNAIRWIEKLCQLGLYVEPLEISQSYNLHTPGLMSELTDALDASKDEQRRRTIAFELMKRGATPEAIIRSVESGSTNLLFRDKGGMTLCHLAAAFDQSVVLQLLVEKKSMSLEETDERGRTVFEVAEASGANSCVCWIIERKAMTTVSNLLSRNVRRYLELQRWEKAKRSAILLQAVWRSFLVRKMYRSVLLRRLAEKGHFEAIWGAILIKFKRKTTDCGETMDGSWSEMKALNLDMRVNRSVLENEHELERTAATLNEATLAALDDDDQEVAVARSVQSVSGNMVESSNERPAESLYTAIQHKQIRMTAEVVKWLRVADSKYIEFFKRKVKQVVVGESSRTLRKQLKGCRSKIYETYLEQVSGHRILWTVDKVDDGLLLWYVAKHKDVSKLARLIDDAKNRSLRQHVSANAVLEGHGQSDDDPIGNVKGWRVLLNPFTTGNSPLKLYEMRFGEIGNVGSTAWKPRLHLTEEERGVVEGQGTVLLLGRSGTGKTLCICNRMDLDLQQRGSDPSFSQLFVARSHPLRKLVKEAIGVADGQRSEFQTFDELLKWLEANLSSESITAHYPSEKMEFNRFNREVYNEKTSGGLDALVVWTSIRSFLKDSIEALQTPERILSMDEFISMEKFGKKRCRLTVEQREAVYKMFVAYNRYMRDLNLWDDCDRISQVLVGLEEARCRDADVFESLRRSKVYVDEIQDYTQAEILLFFYLSGPGDLFLAGDPAQSVVEGVEFRFEEVRSVGHYVAGERRDLIPDKPKTVNVNFRSHSGVLDLAAAVLNCLFGAFPDSAKHLGEDRGLFSGPRPGVIHELPLWRLKQAVSTHLKGAVVLTHDIDAAYVKRALGDYPLVYGIREVKGLEFQRVVLLNFFCGLPKELQKPWRDLLLDRDVSTYQERFPEVEGELKLLYTAITRCIEQLFVVESTLSVAGNAFVRWVTGKKKKGGNVAVGDALAERCSIDATAGLTPDQLRSMGFDHAIVAEEIVGYDLAVAERHLETAQFCFERVNDHILSGKVRSFRSSLRFRRQLLDSTSLDRNGVDELELASLLSILISGGLWSELRSLLFDAQVLRLLPEYSEKQLLQVLLPVLRLQEQSNMKGISTGMPSATGEAGGSLAIQNVIQDYLQDHGNELL